MPDVRPLENSDFDAAAALMARPDVAPFLGLGAFSGPAEMRRMMRGGTALGAFVGCELRACAVITPSSRHRSKHLADLVLFCGPERVSDASTLCCHVVDAAQQWLALFKLEISIDPAAPWLPALLAAGFEIEFRRSARRWRAGSRREDWQLGWCRNGLPSASADSAPRPGLRAARGQFRARALMPTDAVAMAQLHREVSVMRGTLQTPLRTETFWRDRLVGTRSAFRICAEVEGELVGKGVLLRRGSPAFQTLAIGLAVASAWQGRGAGATLLRTLVDAASDDPETHRVELEVDAQNEVARGLYRRVGFVEEGVRRMRSWRSDGYCSTLCMALVFEERL